ncbi:UGSC family (seleno)protein [Natrinema caseinilyticum]|uniref:UGSC family (seleno)protein n=1 Tax=Natrinema caseinilyticum TaxID=2961570 RepID=UPI0020C34E6D|nr:UGSC family (seleno)protein [Natrinema caseinilyticum]
MSSGTTKQRRDEILSPVGEVQTDDRPIATRLSSLEGTTIGFLDNAKTNADVFLAEVSRILTEEYAVEETVHRSKDNTAIPAGSIASYLATHCDAVVNAYGDCGSCTSWCVYDSVDIEGRGTPVATVNSDEFVRLGQSESRSLGMPGLPILTVEHPMGDVPEDVVHERAADAVDEIVSILTENRERLLEEYDQKYLDAGEEIGDEELYCPL